MEGSPHSDHSEDILRSSEILEQSSGKVQDDCLSQSSTDIKKSGQRLPGELSDTDKTPSDLVDGPRRFYDPLEMVVTPRYVHDIPDSTNVTESFKVPSSTKKKNVDSSSSKNTPVFFEDLLGSKDDKSKEDRPKNNTRCTKFNYKIPTWSKDPRPREHILMEIKDGVVVNKLRLMKAFYSFGRSDSNDILALNPTVSRFHAVLQYGDITGGTDFGWYIYDLDSAHGTFIKKKHKINPATYTKIEDCCMFKLGCSSRFYLVEKVMSATESTLEDFEPRTTLKDESDDDDSDDEGDWYATKMINSLKQWFQNEGQKPVFNVEEFEHDQPMSFVCKIRLPLKEVYGDDSEDFEGIGRGKTKDKAVFEAVSNCWEHLETFGITAFGIKRTRDWKENDYYDSDEDPFFDRTGNLETKRQKRMKMDASRSGNSKQKTSSYAEKIRSLSAEKENLVEYIKFLEKEISNKKNNTNDDDKDSENNELDENSEQYKSSFSGDLAKKKSELATISKQIRAYESLMKQLDE